MSNFENLTKALQLTICFLVLTTNAMAQESLGESEFLRMKRQQLNKNANQSQPSEAIPSTLNPAESQPSKESSPRPEEKTGTISNTELSNSSKIEPKHEEKVDTSSDSSAPTQKMKKKAKAKKRKWPTASHHKKKKTKARVAEFSMDSDKPVSSSLAISPPTNEKNESKKIDDNSDQKPRLTGTWGHIRPFLESKGINFDLTYMGEQNALLRGGLERKTVYQQNVIFEVDLDLEKIVSWPGATLRTVAIANNGHPFTENVGAFQAVSNIETKASFFRLYELSLEQMLFENKGSILVGSHDLNSDFYVTPSSGSFINSSFGIGAELSQTGANGPSIFPTTAPAIRIKVQDGQHLSLQWGLFNGLAGDAQHPKRFLTKLNVNDGLLSISEFSLETRHESEIEDKFAVGHWVYSRTFDSLDRTNYQRVNDADSSIPVQTTASGFYILVDKKIFGPLSTFVRYGKALSESVALSENLSFGVLSNHPWGSEDHTLGIGITQVRSTPRFRSVNPDINLLGWERVYELFYKYTIMNGLSIQPDLQYVQHPGMNPSIKDALASIVRLQLTL